MIQLSVTLPPLSSASPVAGLLLLAARRLLTPKEKT